MLFSLFFRWYPPHLFGLNWFPFCLGNTETPRILQLLSRGFFLVAGGPSRLTSEWACHHLCLWIFYLATHSHPFGALYCLEARDRKVFRCLHMYDASTNPRLLVQHAKLWASRVRDWWSPLSWSWLVTKCPRCNFLASGSHLPSWPLLAIKWCKAEWMALPVHQITLSPLLSWHRRRLFKGDWGLTMQILLRWQKTLLTQRFFLEL